MYHVYSKTKCVVFSKHRQSNKNSEIIQVFCLPVPDKALLDDDFQIFVRTKSEFLFTDIEYYPSFKYYTSEFVNYLVR